MTTIAKQILIAILFTVLAVHGISGYFEIQHFTRTEDENIRRQHREIAARIAFNVAKPLVQNEKNRVENIIYYETVDPHISAILAYDNSGNFIAGKYRDSVSGAIKRFDPDIAECKYLIANNTNSYSQEILQENAHVGKIFIYADAEPLNRNIKQQAISLILRILGLIAVISLVLFIILRKLIIDPLSQLNKWAASVAPGKIQPAPILSQNVEIKTLAESFSAMTKKLIDSQNSIVASSKKVKDSEALLRTLTDTIPDLIWLKDTEGVYLLCNHRFEDFFGAKADEIVGKTDYDFVDKTLADFFREKDTLTMSLGKPSVNEETVPFTNDGHTEILETIKTPIYDDNGQLIGVLGIGRNITDRKDTEQKLNESKIRYELAINGSNDGIWDWNLLNNEVFFSKRWKDQVGYDENELDNHFDSFQAIVHEDDKARLREYIEKYLNGEIKQYDIEFRLRHKNQQYIWIRARGKVLRDSNGKPYRMAGSHSDITDRKLAEDELRKSKEKYRDLFENMNDAFVLHKIILDDAGHPVDYEFLDVNPVFAKRLGMRAEDIINRRALDLFPGTEKSWIEAFGRVALTGESVQFTNYSAELDKYYETHVYCPSPGYFAGLFADVTERKKAEAELIKLQAAIESSKASIIITDVSGKIEYANPFFSQISGYTPAEYLGRNPSIIKTGLHTDEFYKNLWTTITAGLTWEGEICNRKKNGDLYWENAVISAIRNADNEIINYVAVKSDITDRKKIEQELLKAKETAEESDRLKTAFLQNMSHEIRTPMNAINGFSDLLTNPKISEEKRSTFIEIIQNSSNQLLHIVEDILTASSLETKQEKVTLQPVNLNKILQNLASIFEVNARNKNIALSLNQVLRDEQAEIFTDKTKLTQIVTNLLNNAIKLTHAGSVEFGYRLTGNEMELYVQDTGIGISAELHEKIFDRFRQADDSIQANYGGSGLGLSISKGFVELLGGRIWVKSEIGKGSTFYFTIPYKPVNPTVQTINPKDCSGKQKTILVAEDEFFNFLLIKEILSGQDFQILHANNGQEAVDMCQLNPDIDIVLMDLKMPVLDGYEATKIIKKAHCGFPIIAQSAYSIEQFRQRYSENVFDDYLVKPISKNSLLQEIHKYLR